MSTATEKEKLYRELKLKFGESSLESAGEQRTDRGWREWHERFFFLPIIFTGLAFLFEESAWVENNEDFLVIGYALLLLFWLFPLIWQVHLGWGDLRRYYSDSETFRSPFRLPWDESGVCYLWYMLKEEYEELERWVSFEMLKTLKRDVGDQNSLLYSLLSRILSPLKLARRQLFRTELARLAWVRSRKGEVGEAGALLRRFDVSGWEKYEGAILARCVLIEAGQGDQYVDEVSLYLDRMSDSKLEAIGRIFFIRADKIVEEIAGLLTLIKWYEGREETGECETCRARLKAFARDFPLSPLLAGYG